MVYRREEKIDVWPKCVPTSRHKLEVVFKGKKLPSAYFFLEFVLFPLKENSAEK